MLLYEFKRDANRRVTKVKTSLKADEFMCNYRKSVMHQCCWAWWVRREYVSNDNFWEGAIEPIKQAFWNRWNIGLKGVSFDRVIPKGDKAWTDSFTITAEEEPNFRGAV